MPIFEAWSDLGWINDGAAVRVSVIAFGNVDQEPRLDGELVGAIHADLTAGVNLTTAKVLSSNRQSTFVATVKSGAFDVSGATARSWLRLPNPHGRSNADVVRRWANGMDMTRRWSDTWIIDFGVDMPQMDAALFEQPFAHIRTHVQPIRSENKRKSYRENWWLLAEPIPKMRVAINDLPRFVATPVVAKYRLYVWLDRSILPDHQLVVTARADDTTFGILHSRFHELWSLRLGTSLEDRPRYTPTTCFETFPFPAGLTPHDTKDQQTETLEDGAVIPARPSAASAAPGASPKNEGVACWPPENDSDNRQCHRVVRDESLFPETNKRSDGNYHGAQSQTHDTIREHAIAIARAAKRLNDLRERWLNPPEWTERVPEVIPLGMDASPYPDRILPRANLAAADAAELKKRTLTNLYNQRPAWLADAHAALDAAVAAAYGWTDYASSMTDNEILARLLALNHERSARSANAPAQGSL
jgi:hypothetical protein